jgi:hypothetical protein
MAQVGLAQTIVITVQIGLVPVLTMPQVGLHLTSQVNTRTLVLKNWFE